MRNRFETAKKIFMIAIAVIAWFALVVQLYLHLKTTASTGFSYIKTIINFLSYFTVLSNLLVAICLTASLCVPSSLPGSFFLRATVQSAIAVYIFFVSLVYNVALRNLWVPTGWQLVADNLLHVVIPVIYLSYWVIFTPKKMLHWKNIIPWLIFPTLYLIGLILRGLVAGWYPYPFVHAGDLGYGKVVLNALLVLIVFVAVGLGLIAFNRQGKTSLNVKRT